MPDPTIAPRVKDLIVRRLKLEIDPTTIQDDAPLFGEGLGLDSIDALELVLGLEQEFGIKVEDEEVGRQGLRVGQRPGRLHRAEEDRVTAPGALPHGYPFRFVDAVVEERNADFSRGRVRVGVTVNGRAAMGEQWGSPLLLAEAIAQAALLLQRRRSGDGPPRFPGRPRRVRGRAARRGRARRSWWTCGSPPVSGQGRAFRRGSALRAARIDRAREYPRAQRR